jgi:parvulin-like peptidyl-prolyl isomerase
MDRTGIGKSGPAGAQVVAEIGAEKITSADLDAIIENAIDSQLSPMAAFITDEQLNEQKKKTLDQYKAPQAKQQFLQSWLAQEILYREALEEHLSGRPEIKKLLDELTRGVLSQQLMNQQLASKINVTETDLETYYAANKAKFVEPAKARISHILVKEEEQAKDLIKRLKNGEDFAKLAEEHSTDEETKNNGGKIDADVTKGAHVPVIGDVNGLNDRIFAAEASAVLDEPVETDKGWEIIRLDTKQAERRKNFDEVRQQVMMMLTDQKRQDVQQSYIKQMMNKYNVIIHTSVLMPSQEAPAEASPAGPQKQI